MSTIFDDARVTILFADYINPDPSGKFNAIGLGANILTLQPNLQQHLSSPVGIAVIIEVPRKHTGSQFAWALELRDLTTDSAVKVPTAPSGALDALRIQQLSRVDPVMVPGIVLPDDANCRVQFVAAFQNGIPLEPGHAYEWQMSIDGHRRKSWAYRFVVLGPPPSPILGGPIGPSSIPNIVQPQPVEDDPQVD